MPEFKITLIIKTDANEFYEYKFEMSFTDEARMLRALCYYDNALFQNGEHRQQLLSNESKLRVNMDSPSGMIHKNMISAYRAIMQEFEDAFIQIKTVEKTGPVLLATTSTRDPVFKRVHQFPDPITYDSFRFCAKRGVYQTEEIAEKEQNADL